MQLLIREDRAALHLYWASKQQVAHYLNDAWQLALQVAALVADTVRSVPLFTYTGPPSNESHNN